MGIYDYGLMGSDFHYQHLLGLFLGSTNKNHSRSNHRKWCNRTEINMAEKNMTVAKDRLSRPVHAKAMDGFDSVDEGETYIHTYILVFWVECVS